MSYQRHLTSLYKSDLKQLNRTLRSSSVPRHVPELETVRVSRSCSVPRSISLSSSWSSSTSSSSSSSSSSSRSSRSSSRATPFMERASRAVSVQPYMHNTWLMDRKAEQYMDKLVTEDRAKTSLSNDMRNRKNRNDSFSSRYNFYDGSKHERDYMYPMSSEVLGSWKHFNLSTDTVNCRNSRARSPLQSRELDRYFETRKFSNYIGDVSSGGSVDFRHYNYRAVPYFGGSDYYQFVKIRPSARRI